MFVYINCEELHTLKSVTSLSLVNLPTVLSVLTSQSLQILAMDLPLLVNESLTRFHLLVSCQRYITHM